ncbi:MAG: GIN domain-containing protein [Sphingomonadaceae bacterium]
MRHCSGLIAIFAITGCTAAPVVVDNGPQISRAYAAAGFDGVTLTGPDRVKIVEGRGFLVTAKGSKLLLDYLEISVISNVLVIERKQQDGVAVNGKVAEVTVTMPVITRAAVEGSGDMDINAPATGNFTGAVSGSGNMTISALRADAASFASSGSGKITAMGAATSAKIAATGSGDVIVRGAATCVIAKTGSGAVSCQQ